MPASAPGECNQELNSCADHLGTTAGRAASM
jgi:hypothetical protein